MIERFNTLKAQISNLETLTNEEKQEFQQLLWKLEKFYIVACEDINEEDLKSIIEYPDYKILDVRDMKNLLNNVSCVVRMYPTL